MLATMTFTPPNTPKPNPSQTKRDQENGLGFSWIPSSDSSFFNGLRANQVTGAKVRSRRQPFGFWRAGELASDSSDSISHSQHHLLCECVPGLLPLLRGTVSRQLAGFGDERFDLGGWNADDRSRFALVALQSGLRDVIAPALGPLPRPGRAHPVAPIVEKLSREQSFGRLAVSLHPRGAQIFT